MGLRFAGVEGPRRCGPGLGRARVAIAPGQKPPESRSLLKSAWSAQVRTDRGQQAASASSPPRRLSDPPRSHKLDSRRSGCGFRVCFCGAQHYFTIWLVFKRTRLSPCTMDRPRAMQTNQKKSYCKTFFAWPAYVPEFHFRGSWDVPLPGSYCPHATLHDVFDIYPSTELFKSSLLSSCNLHERCVSVDLGQAESKILQFAHAS